MGTLESPIYLTCMFLEKAGVLREDPFKDSTQKDLFLNSKQESSFYEATYSDSNCKKKKKKKNFRICIL